MGGHLPALRLQARGRSAEGYHPEACGAHATTGLGHLGRGCSPVAITLYARKGYGGHGLYRGARASNLKYTGSGATGSNAATAW